MPKFFFNIRFGSLLIPDEEGSDLPDLEAVQDHAEASAREIVRERIKHGRPVNGLEFEIVDVRGIPVLSLPMASVIE